MGLGLPLLSSCPARAAGDRLRVRASLAPLRRFRDELAARTRARSVPGSGQATCPPSSHPLADTLNSLLARLQAAFEAERSFAANAAHELRTPLAGAIAQVQRLRSETRTRRRRRGPPRSRPR